MSRNFASLEPRGQEEPGGGGGLTVTPKPYAYSQLSELPFRYIDLRHYKKAGPTANRNLAIKQCSRFWLTLDVWS